MSTLSNLISCATIPGLSNSDHLGLPLLLLAGFTSKRPKTKSRSVWKYSQANFDLARELLENTNWDEILTEDVNTSWDNWRTRFLKVMEHCIPRVEIKAKRNLPWLTNSVVRAIRKRNSYFRSAKKTKSTTAFQKYRAARNRATALLRNNKTKFFKRLGNSSNNDFWKAIKLLNKKDSCIPTLKHCQDGIDIVTNTDKAAVLNNYVYECFNSTLPPLPTHVSWLDPGADLGGGGGGSGGCNPPPK